MSEELAEVTDVHDELLPAVPEQASLTLFGTNDPVAVLEKATSVARALANVIDEQNLYTTISGKKHLQVEAWTMLGSMLGVFPETEWTRETVDSKGSKAWEARVVARTRDGAVIGAREAMCSRSESRWKNADDHALRSMAQTRAVSGALAAPLRFVPVLAGFAGTPEAEMERSQREGEERRVDAPEVSVPRSWAEVLERAKAQLEDANAPIWLAQAKEIADKLPAPTAFQRICGVIVDIDASWTGDFPPRSRQEIRDAFAKRLDGIAPEGPEWRIGPDEQDRPTRDELEAAAASSDAKDEAEKGGPTNEDDDLDKMWEETK